MLPWTVLTKKQFNVPAYTNITRVYDMIQFLSYLQDLNK